MKKNVSGVPYRSAEAAKSYALMRAAADGAIDPDLAAKLVRKIVTKVPIKYQTVCFVPWIEHCVKD